MAEIAGKQRICSIASGQVGIAHTGNSSSWSAAGVGRASRCIVRRLVIDENHQQASASRLRQADGLLPIQTFVDAGIRDVLVVTGGRNSGDSLRLLANGFSRLSPAVDH